MHVAAATASIHGRALASIVGRIVSNYSSNGWLDSVTRGYIPVSCKNYLAVFVALGLLGLAMNEKQLLLRAWDTTLTDAFANEVLMIFGTDKTIIPGFATAPKA